MLDFKDMMRFGESQHIKCANCIYYKADECRLNPLAVGKEADYFCGRFVALEQGEGVVDA